MCGDLADAEGLLEPLHGLETPILGHWVVTSYAATHRIQNDPTEPMPAVGKGALMHDLSEATMERVPETVGPLAAKPFVSLHIRHIDGATVRGLREARYLLYAVGSPTPTPPTWRSHRPPIAS